MEYVKHKVSRLFHTLKHKLRLNNISIFRFCLTENTAHLRYESQVGDIMNGSDVCLLKKHVNPNLELELKMYRICNYRSSLTG